MKKISYIFPAIILFLLLFASCKKNDYIVDGGLASANVNVTTYDFLKSNPLFDTLALLINRAGLKNAINAQGVTFFAPTDYCIQRFLIKETELLRIRTGGFENYTIDSINNTMLADTLKKYIVTKKVNRDDLPTPMLTTNTRGDTVNIALVESVLYTEWVRTKPKFLYYTLVKNGLDDPNNPPSDVADQDISIRCQTSGIITTTGILHVLSDTHYFGFVAQ